MMLELFLFLVAVVIHHSARELLCQRLSMPIPSSTLISHLLLRQGLLFLFLLLQFVVMRRFHRIRVQRYRVASRLVYGGSLDGYPVSSRDYRQDRRRARLMVQRTPLDEKQASDYGIECLVAPEIRLQWTRITPDDRSGSMANVRRTQSQNRFLEGRVCFVIRARHDVRLRLWIGGKGEHTLDRHGDVDDRSPTRLPSQKSRQILGLFCPIFSSKGSSRELLSASKLGWTLQERKEFVLRQKIRTLVHRKESLRNSAMPGKSQCSPPPLVPSLHSPSNEAIASGNLDVNAFTASRSFEIKALQTAMRSSKLHF
jgi:hypothetical protein